MDGSSDFNQRSQRKPKGEGHLRRDEILRAAEAIFVREGYEGATIRKIAEMVGVSTTTLYMHFRDKDAIVLEISKDGLKDLEAIHIKASVDIEDPVERLRFMAHAYVEFGLQNPNLYELIFCLSDRALAPETQSALTELGVVCFQTFASTCEEIEILGRLRSGGAMANLQVVWTGCHGLTHMLISNTNFPWAPVDQLSNLLINSLINGLTKD